MCGSIPPLPQYVFMAWCFVKHREKFTFTLQTSFFFFVTMTQIHLKSNYLVHSASDHPSTPALVWREMAQLLVLQTIRTQASKSNAWQAHPLRAAKWIWEEQVKSSCFPLLRASIPHVQPPWSQEVPASCFERKTLIPMSFQIFLNISEPAWLRGGQPASNSRQRHWSDFLLSSPPRPDQLWSPPSHWSNGYRVTFPGGKADVAWSWSLTSTYSRG
jgi:hypothetical protein